MSSFFKTFAGGLIGGPIGAILGSKAGGDKKSGDRQSTIIAPGDGSPPLDASGLPVRRPSASNFLTGSNQLNL